MRRRAFLRTPAAATLAAGLAPQVRAAEPGTVLFTGDGIAHTPEEYADLLKRIAPGVAADNYSREGMVAKLEEKVAADLGKEMAVWLPTGTLANHLAVRVLAGEKRRVAVQKESHLFNDCGDCCQTLSGLHLIPLGDGEAAFRLGELQFAVERGNSGRVAVPLGALQIETPVRRKNGQMFDWAEAKRIAAWARARGVGLHLDGARLYLASAYSGVSVREYAAEFDTVYVSMYKYFNAASGAMLAGPKRLLEDLYHTRRMFGGGLSQVWPFAAVALHFFDGFSERYRVAVKTSEEVLAALEADARFTVERVPYGTNISYLRLKSGYAPDFWRRANSAGLRFGEPNGGRFTVQVNETWARQSSSAILDRLRKAV